MSKQEMMNKIRAEIESIEARIKFLSFDIGNGISKENKAEIAQLVKKYQGFVALAKKVMAGDFEEAKSRRLDSSRVHQHHHDQMAFQQQNHHNQMVFQQQQLRDLHGSW